VSLVSSCGIGLRHRCCDQKVVVIRFDPIMAGGFLLLKRPGPSILSPDMVAFTAIRKKSYEMMDFRRISSSSRIRAGESPD